MSTKNSTTLLFMYSLISLLIVIHAPPIHSTETTEKTLRIGIKEAPPFVIYDGKKYSGLSIDLWQEIADKNNWKFKYHPYGLTELLDATAAQEIDLGLGALTATSDRALRMDFSHTITSSGLSVAVRSEWSSGWMAVLSALASMAFLKIIGLLTAVLLSVGFLIWLVEHKKNKEEFGGTTAEGLFSGFWWAMVTMTTVGYGDISPRTVKGRILGLVWMLTALIIVSFFTASITSALTVGQLNNNISGPEDLKGTSIASVTGSTSALWLEQRKLGHTKVKSLSDALEQLKDGKVDAVVYDEPLLRWTIEDKFSGKIQVLPMRLVRQDYVFILPDNSPLRERIDAVLLDKINSPDWPTWISNYFISN